MSQDWINLWSNIKIIPHDFCVYIALKFSRNCTPYFSVDALAWIYVCEAVCNYCVLCHVIVWGKFHFWEKCLLNYYLFYCFQPFVLVLPTTQTERHVTSCLRSIKRHWKMLVMQFVLIQHLSRFVSVMCIWSITICRLYR